MNTLYPALRYLLTTEAHLPMSPTILERSLHQPFLPPKCLIPAGHGDPSWLPEVHRDWNATTMHLMRDARIGSAAS